MRILITGGAGHLAEGIEGRQGLYSTAKIESELGWQAYHLLPEENLTGGTP